MRRRRPVDEERGLDLIERAVHLLRTTPASTFMLFYVGAIPFLLAILFFLADMSSSPFADERCAGAALGVGLSYIWMRTWQSLFCRRLSSTLGGRSGKALTFNGVITAFRFHLLYSAWALVLLPLSAVTTIPFAWVYAYFNTLCIVDPVDGMKEAATKAGRLALLRPKQNFILIGVLIGFAYFVFMNWIMVLAQLPGLLKSLAGIETPLAQSWYWIGNTTFIGVVISLSYLIVEPLIKAVYVLRFHACESIETGEDLLAELKSIVPRRSLTGLARLVLIMSLLTGLAYETKAQEKNRSDDHSARIETAELDRSIDKVMKQREFTWRMPREMEDEGEEKGFLGKFMDSVFQWMEDGLKSAWEAFERFLEWLGDRMTPSERREVKTPGLDPAFFKGLAVLLTIILVVVILVLLTRVYLARRKPLPEMEEAEADTIKVDIEDENVIATMLEEDEWIKLARELAAEGELRKAMRAWFLAGLAFLSGKDLLSILHSKSNLEYRRELSRRARRNPELIPVFGNNIELFERAWYGLYPATTEDLDVLEKNVERMRHDTEA